MIFIFLLFVFLVLAFEVWMIIDAIQNQRLRNTERLLWLLGMVFIHPFVAIAYYFMSYRKSA